MESKDGIMPRGVDAEKRATLRRFAAVGAISPLAGLIDAETAGENTTRKAIVGYVSTTPGAHFSKIRDDLELGTGETQYHLRKLIDRDVIESRRDGEYKRYFRAGEFTNFEQLALGYLRRKTPRGIMIAVLRDPSVAAGALASKVGVSPSTISKYTAELRDAGLLAEGDGYYLVNAEIILVLVIRYADSFGSQSVSLANDAAGLISLTELVE